VNHTHKLELNRPITSYHKSWWYCKFLCGKLQMSSQHGVSNAYCWTNM